MTTTTATADRQDRKSYAQICPISTALDVIGDRWTPLLLRELLGGPARFSELEDGLQGVAKNLLTSRLRRLESDGIIERVSVHGATLYALTEQGAAIRPTLEELGFWGSALQRVAPVEYGRSIRAFAMALQAVLVRAGDALPEQRYVIELDIDGEQAEIVLGPRPTVTARPSPEADARIAVPTATVSDVVLGEPFNPAEFVCVSGDEAAKDVLVGALTVMAPAAEA